MTPSKSILCPRIEMPGKSAWLPELLAGREALYFQQTWLPEPEPDFMPGQVWMGWMPEGFRIWAELADRDIFNPVTEFNRPAFLKGDVFEIFLKPESSEVYYEFHVNPNNQLFQYRIPSGPELQQQRGKGIRTEWLIPEPVIHSAVEVDPAKSQWRVRVQIPVQKLGLSELKSFDRWRFSFSRYDYSQNLQEPVLSSCSKHRKLDFHDQSAWLTVKLE